MAFRTSEKQSEGPHVKEEVLINSKFKYKLIFFNYQGTAARNHVKMEEHVWSQAIRQFVNAPLDSLEVFAKEVSA